MKAITESVLGRLAVVASGFLLLIIVLYTSLPAVIFSLLYSLVGLVLTLLLYAFVILVWLGMGWLIVRYIISGGPRSKKGTHG